MDFLKKLFSNRIFYIFLIMIIGFGAVIVRLYSLQLTSNGAYINNGAVLEYNLPLDSPRGNIYDRNGVLLATNRTAYKVYMINTSDSQALRDEMYLELINLLDKNGDVYYNYLKDYLTFPLSWGPKIDEEDETVAKRNWINGLVSSRTEKEFFETPEGAFDYLRNTLFNIDEKYTDEEAYKIMIIRYLTYSYGLDSITPSVIATDCCEETANYIDGASNVFRGVFTEKTYYRVYVNCETIGAIIGYVRAISSSEYEEKKDQGYLMDDIIGKLGIEASCEDLLRGQRGYVKLVRTTDGVIHRTEIVDPVPGNSVYMTIDIRLQNDVYNSLVDNIAYVLSRENGVDNFGDCKAGSIIVNDVNSGEILASATYPTYSNLIFIAPSNDIDAQNAIRDLFKDPSSPSLNRVTQGLYPIGSMVKPAIALASLQAGVMNENTKVYCPGYILAGGRQQKCLQVHGDLTLEMAMAKSCNTFFATMGIKLGIDEIDKWFKAFGLGEKSGIEITEYVGNRSNPHTMDIFEDGRYHRWTESSTAQTCIGQLYTRFSPVQVARYISAIASNGKLYDMHLVKMAISPNGEKVYEKEIKYSEIECDQENLKLVQNAMIAMGNYYADLKSNMRGYPSSFIAGKTGTAQTGDNDDSSHAFFMCYAPAKDPQISIVIALENGAYSGNSFMSVRRICDSYFGGSYVEGQKGGISQFEYTNKTTQGGLAPYSQFKNALSLVVR